MEKVNVSVIFATYNRSDIIEDVLNTWVDVAEHTKYSFEIICSDDESSDDTVKKMEAFDKLPIVILKNKHGGASRARNTALSVAKGELIIFTGDDIFPTRDFVNKHYENYLMFGSKMCTLGRIEWHDGIEKNHLMTHITNIGCEQFGFAGLIPYGIADFRHFYTSNISVARSELDKLDKFFDLSFDRYGFEDVELGYRLHKNGVLITYDPDVLAYHHHVYEDVDKFCNRQLNAGSQIVVMSKLHEEVLENPILGFKKFDLYIRKVLDDYAENASNETGARGKEIEAFVEERKLRSKELEKLIKQDDKIEYRDECSAIYRFIFQFYMYKGWAQRIAQEYVKTEDNLDYFLYEMIYDFMYSGYVQIFKSDDNNISEEGSVRYDNNGRLFEIELEENIKNLRLDPFNRPCIIKNLNVVEVHNNKQKLLQHSNTNGIVSGNSFDFSNESDSQIRYSFFNAKKKNIRISFELYCRNDLAQEFNYCLENEKARKNNYYKRVEQQRTINLFINETDEIINKYRQFVEKKFGNRIVLTNVKKQENFYTNYECKFVDGYPTEKEFIEVCKDLYYSFTAEIKRESIEARLMTLNSEYNKQDICCEGLLSVVIPSYNHEKYIGYAIESVLNQSYSNLELIIIDDGSKDNSEKIIKSYHDDRIKYVAQQNAGAHNAINRGLQMARGEYLAILNSDDSFATRRFEIMIDQLKKEEADFACSYIQIIDSDNNNMGIKRGDIDMLSWEAKVPGESYYVTEDFGLNLVMTNFTSTTSNFLFTRKLYDTIGGMRNLRFAHDWDFALRAAEQFKCIIVDKPLMEYRVHNSNTISSNRAWMLFEIVWMWATNLERYYQKGIFTQDDKKSIKRLGNSINLQGNDKVFWMIKMFIDSERKQGVLKPEEILLDDAELRQEFINFIEV